jgi:hypothetical protein
MAETTSSPAATEIAADFWSRTVFSRVPTEMGFSGVLAYIHDSAAARSGDANEGSRLLFNIATQLHLCGLLVPIGPYANRHR